jgi:hypothetical protein
MMWQVLLVSLVFAGDPEVKTSSDESVGSAEMSEVGESVEAAESPVGESVEAAVLEPVTLEYLSTPPAT